MARTEFGVAVASVLIVAGVLAIPLVAPTQTVARTPILHPLVTTPSPTPSAEPS